MHGIRRTIALVMALGLHAPPDASHAGAPQPVSVACNVGTLVLDKPGSYVLTGGTINCALSEAISITASKVVLDLGGRTLDGADQGGTFGILITGEKVVVRNGTVQDFGTGILSFGSRGVIDGVDAISNMNDGMEIGNETVVSNSRVALNVGDGLEGGDGNILRRNVFAQNGARGVFLDDGNTLVENTASANGTFGFALSGDDNKLLRNVAAFNVIQGFESGERTLLKGNTAASNGGHGIYVNAALGGGGSRLTGNVATGNGSNGLFTEGSNLVEKNRAFANGIGGIVGTRGTFKGNEVSGNGFAGLFVSGGLVTKNTCTGNQFGIHTGDNAESVILTGNVAIGNAKDGIFIPELLDPGATQILKNVVNANGEQGIDLPDGVTPIGVGKNSARGNLQQPECDAGLCGE